MDMAAIAALAPVVPVLTIERQAEAVPLALALVQGGLRELELTLRTGLAQGSRCPTGWPAVLPHRRDRDAEAAPSYLVAPNVACIGGSWVAPREAAAGGNWLRIERLAAAAARLKRS